MASDLAANPPFHRATPDERVDTSCQGFISISFQDLCYVFGEPHDEWCDVWCIKFRNGAFATIYTDKYETEPYENVTEWRVGGDSYEAYCHLRQAIIDAFDKIGYTIYC